MTPDLDRLADFYERVFGAEILARAEGEPRKCFIRLTADTNLHVFEQASAVKPADDPFDSGAINHFALEARDPETFVAIRDELLAEGRATEAVYDAPDVYTLFATDPDGLLIEMLVPKKPGWTPPFATEPFVPLGK
jgi:catechol 2,3-dioxygenase-like lactoylglutathione lyase family enzyme